MNVIRLPHRRPPEQIAGENPPHRKVDPGAKGTAASALAGLVGLRAAAALAVVLLHACVPYLRHPMPGLVWPVRDAGGEWVDCAFWTIEVFIMPLFLAIAGFLLWRSARRSTPWQLVRSRAQRLLVPLAFGMLVVLPADLYIWAIGLVAEGAMPAVKLKSLKFDAPISDQIWGLSHLWFLLYVFLYVAVIASVLWIGRRIEIGQRFRNVLSGSSAVVAIVAVAIMALVIAPEVVWGFQHAFLPVPSKWIYSGAFFVGGWLLAARDPELRWTSMTCWRTGGVGVITLFASVGLGRWYLQRAEEQLPVDTATVFVLAVLTTLAAGATTLALIGGSTRYFRRAPKAIQYVAAASFWIYLVHHPLVGLLHIDLKWALGEGNPGMKAAASCTGAVLLSLATYECFVRRTRLGVWLGMERRPTSAVPAGTSADPIERDAAVDSGARRAA
ncbi:acyltransferase [Roseiconus nitratireducens]|uniref:Acyltransferase n=1 Tax=Roseiconus nitratireducens TaxID=2605748 RepID=A0A5M6DD00_9BACT|nr:acyltransferase [Roseiconus nitratireducens]KAA5545283.1 acyltransferase [Roseiconus nitratireducens]